MEIVALYLVLLFIYPEATLFITGLFVLGVAEAAATTLFAAALVLPLRARCLKLGLDSMS